MSLKVVALCLHFETENDLGPSWVLHRGGRLPYGMAESTGNGLYPRREFFFMKAP